MQQNLSCRSSSAPVLGDRHLGKQAREGGRKEGRDVSQSMALGTRDKTSTQRNKNSPTTQEAELQARLGCSMEGVGKSALVLQYFSSMSGKKSTLKIKKKVEKQKKKGKDAEREGG